jgi:hypothetical protein
MRSTFNFPPKRAPDVVKNLEAVRCECEVYDTRNVAPSPWETRAGRA